MIHQHQPMKWPPDKPVDWADATERSTWVSELRDHLYDLFVVGFDSTKPLQKGSLTRTEARESLLANKQVIDGMLGLAGAPLDLSEKMEIPLPSPRSNDPPELAAGPRSPFKELPAAGWTEDERAKWLGYVEGQLDYLTRLVLAAYPEGSDGYLRGRWAVIRLRVLFAKLRVALLMTPMRR